MLLQFSRLLICVCVVFFLPDLGLFVPKVRYCVFSSTKLCGPQQVSKLSVLTAACRVTRFVQLVMLLPVSTIDIAGKGLWLLIYKGQDRTGAL